MQEGINRFKRKHVFAGIYQFGGQVVGGISRRWSAGGSQEILSRKGAESGKTSHHPSLYSGTLGSMAIA